MVEAVSNTQPAIKPFTTIKYVTKDGENITATKKDGIVTLVGDKNGVRQIPLDDFMKKELPNVANIKLEKSPEADTLEISKTQEKIVAETKSADKPQANQVGKKLDVAA